MPTAFIFLGAEIENEAFDEPLPFTSPFGRERHDRLLMHFGLESALLVQIDEAVGAIPAGSTLEAALRYLWELVVEMESIIRHTFTLDAYSDEDVFWRDTFARIVAEGLGITTGDPSRFGNTEWQRFDTDGTMEAEVNEEAIFTGTIEASNEALFIGYPTITAGELYFEFYFPLTTTTNEIEWQPWRDDVTDTRISVRLRFIAGNWFLDLRLGDLLTEARTNPADVWWAARILIDEPGNTVAIKLWPRDDAEPDDWDAEGTLPAAAISPRWVAVGGSSKMSRSDDAVTWTADTISGNLNDIVYGPAFGVPTWMVTSSNSGIRYSRDADTWTAVTTANSPAGTLPAFGTCATDGDGTWIAAGNATTPNSAVWRAIGDPATSFWNRQTTPLPNGVHKVRWINDRFIIISQFGTMATSPDGGTGNWTNRTTGMDPDEDWLDDAAYGNGIYMVHGGGGPGFNEFKTLTSPDGDTWTLHTIAALEDYFPVACAFGQGLFVVVGFDGVVASSPDGETWTVHSSGITTDLRDVGYADGMWVAVGDGGKLYTTTDPTGTWTEQTSGFSTTQITSINGHSLGSSGMPFLTVSNADNNNDDPILLDNIKIVSKTDSDAVRIYHALRLDAEIASEGVDVTIDAIIKATLAGSFTENAIVKASRSASFTLDAVVRVTRSGSFTLDGYVAGTIGSFTLDAWVTATVSASFTLDAYVPGGESGLLGDHTLGEHELGGD